MDRKIDPRRQRDIQQRLRLGNQSPRAQGPATRIAAASESQNLVDEIARPLRASANRTEIAKQPSVRTEALFYHFRMAENPAQNIVEVMGQTTGERTYRLHAAGLLQARLQPCPFLFHRVPPNRRDNGIESHAQQAEFAGRRDATRPADRIETQRNAGAVVVDMRDAAPSPQGPTAMHASLFSPGGIRLTRGTWIIPSTAGPSRAASANAFSGQPGEKPISALHQRCIRGAGPDSTK
jgi:hypothetical protein